MGHRHAALVGTDHSLSGWTLHAPWAARDRQQGMPAAPGEAPLLRAYGCGHQREDERAQRERPALDPVGDFLGYDHGPAEGRLHGYDLKPCVGERRGNLRGAVSLTYLVAPGRRAARQDRLPGPLGDVYDHHSAGRERTGHHAKRRPIVFDLFEALDSEDDVESVLGHGACEVRALEPNVGQVTSQRSTACYAEQLLAQIDPEQPPSRMPLSERQRKQSVAASRIEHAHAFRPPYAGEYLLDERKAQPSCRRRERQSLREHGTEPRASEGSAVSAHAEAVRSGSLTGMVGIMLDSSLVQPQR